MDTPDLTGARTYRATELDRGDRWHVLPDDTVIYERRPGEYGPSIIKASTLTNTGTWTEVHDT